MKAVVLRSFGGSEQLLLENVPDPEPAFDEIALKVATVSINRSFDLSVRKGTYSRGAVLPLVPGADPSGTVCAIGKSVTAFKVGDRVAVMSTIACGRCQECRRGAAASCGFSCTIGVHRWGGYAGDVLLDLKRLYVGRIQIIGAAGVNVSDLDRALAAGARGDISATIDRVYPLECAAEAQDYVERERPLGKVLIAPGRNFENVRQERPSP